MKLNLHMISIFSSCFILFSLAADDSFWGTLAFYGKFLSIESFFTL